MTGDAIGKFVIFTSGVAIGVAITMKYMQSKYERIVKEDIESVKEVYSNKLKEIMKNEDKTEQEVEEEPESESESVVDEVPESKIDYSKILTRNNYTSNPKKNIEEDSPYDGPYVIAPEHFGEYDDYEQVELTLYADGFVTYSVSGEVIDDVDEVIGLENLDYMGTYDDHAIHIRDDERQIDYEVLQDLTNYKDLVRDGTEE